MSGPRNEEQEKADLGFDGEEPWQPAPVFEAVCIAVLVLSALGLAAVSIWYCW